MMNDTLIVRLTLEEVCEAADLPTEVLIEIVEEGVLEPKGNTPEEWTFDATMLSIVKRATRLHRDFDIEWTSIPLLLDMLNEMEQLRSENKLLKQRLNRFLME